MTGAEAVSLIYFGKLRSRGDFVRSPQQPALVLSVDRWISGALERMAVDARWKERYDRAPAFHFAVLGPQRGHAVVGHVRPSADTSGRRFPFLVAGSLALSDPERFMPLAPLALAPLWALAEQGARRAQAEPDASAALGALAQSRLPVDTEALGSDHALADFLDQHSLGSLQTLLQAAHPDVDLARAVMGLGLLLQPVPASGIQRLDKGLRLPLPRDPLAQSMVAAWWLSLITRFLCRADFEVLLLLPQPPAAPHLCVGFAGGSSGALADMLGHLDDDSPFIDLGNPAWADEAGTQDHGLRKLHSYLQQRGLSLRQARRTFRETFLGDTA
jgi:type VI secretion system protein ImpM